MNHNIILFVFYLVSGIAAFSNFFTAKEGWYSRFGWICAAILFVAIAFYHL